MSNYLGFQPTDSSRYYFVSYSSEDAYRISPTAVALSQRIPLWYDYGLPYGNDWKKEIADHIEHAEAVLLFMSKNVLAKGNDSYVYTEYQMAKDYFHKPIIIIQIDEIQKEDVPNELLGWWIELRRYQNIVRREQTLPEALADLIHRAVVKMEKKTSSPQTNMSPVPRELPKKKSFNLALMALLAVLVVGTISVLIIVNTNKKKDKTRTSALDRITSNETTEKDDSADSDDATYYSRDGIDYMRIPTAEEIAEANASIGDKFDNLFIELSYSFPGIDHVTECSADIHADEVPPDTAITPILAELNISSLKSCYKNTYVAGSSPYPFVACSLSNIGNGIMQFTMFFTSITCENDLGITHTYTPNLLYSYEQSTQREGLFNNEGVCGCAVTFEWFPGKDYRILLQQETPTSSLDFIITAWICDLESGIWTKLVSIDTGFSVAGVCLKSFSSVLTCKSADSYGDFRTSEFSNIRVLPKNSSEWVYSDEVWVKPTENIYGIGFPGSYNYSIDGSTVWLIMSGIKDLSEPPSKNGPYSLSPGNADPLNKPSDALEEIVSDEGSSNEQESADDERSYYSKDGIKYMRIPTQEEQDTANLSSEDTFDDLAIEIDYGFKGIDIFEKCYVDLNIDLLPSGTLILPALSYMDISSLNSKYSKVYTMDDSDPYVACRLDKDDAGNGYFTMLFPSIICEDSEGNVERFIPELIDCFDKENLISYLDEDDIPYFVVPYEWLTENTYHFILEQTISQTTGNTVLTSWISNPDNDEWTLLISIDTGVKDIYLQSVYSFFFCSSPLTFGDIRSVEFSNLQVMPVGSSEWVYSDEVSINPNGNNYGFGFPGSYNYRIDGSSVFLVMSGVSDLCEPPSYYGSYSLPYNNTD